MVYVIYDKESGNIRHLHSVYDGRSSSFVSLTREEVLWALSTFFPEPEKVDVLALEGAAASQLHRMRVNPIEKQLEPIQPNKGR